MKTLYTAILASTTLCASADTFNLTNSGFSFTPPVIEMTTADDIQVVLPSPHTCTEVSQATWNANGNTSNGGFNFSSGTHTITIDMPGTYYYVCIPHASMGMKGMIIVTSTTGVGEHNALIPMHLSPNPASSSVRLGIATTDASSRINVLDVNGRVAMEMPAPANCTLDVSRLEVGTYTVVLKNGQGDMLARERLVITR
jgi:plastocyanin